MGVQMHGSDTSPAQSAKSRKGSPLAKKWLWQCAHRALRITLLLGTPPLHAASQCKLDELSVLPVSMHGMRALVPAAINGRSVAMLVDTGMSRSMLAQAALEQLGLQLGPSKSTLIKGVTGTATVESTQIGDFELGSQSFHDVKLFVGGYGSDGGASGLIGRDLMGAGDVEYDFANGIIRFLKLQECGGISPVYWKSHTSANTIRIIGANLNSKSGIGRPIMTTASLNGIALRVMLDTGAGSSILSSLAARNSGVTPATPGVVPAPMTVGLGGLPVKTWIGTFSSLHIGNETVRNTRIRFGDLNSENVDMFLGADFFLSHRMIVADSQQTIYATYNGGAVFDSGTDTKTHETITLDLTEPNVRVIADALPQFADHNSPTDAATYSRRGMAFASRLDYDRAISDLTRACKLERGQANYFLQRGQIYLTAGRFSLAQADFDVAINLKADYVEALVARATVRIDNGDRNGAKSDLDAAASYASPAADLRFDIATTYIRVNLPAQSLTQMDLWVSTHMWDPNMPSAQNMRCLAKGLLNADLDNALRACNVALAYRPQNVAGLANRGLVRFRMRHYEAALADFDAALMLKPDLVVALYRRGIVKLRLGRNADGHADISAARALDSNIGSNERAFDIVP